MINYLSKKKCHIKYYDPTGQKEEFVKLRNVKYFNSISSACHKSDLIIIHTEWNEFKLLDFKKLAKKKKIKVFDMRNIYSYTKMKQNGFKYFGVGK